MTDVSLNIVPATELRFELQTRRSKLPCSSTERGVEEILREEGGWRDLGINMNEENVIIRARFDLT